VDARDQGVSAMGGYPQGVLAPDRAELGDDHQALGVRVQGISLGSTFLALNAQTSTKG